MIFVPHLSANRSFCTDLDRSPLHKFKFSAILGITNIYKVFEITQLTRIFEIS